MKVTISKKNIKKGFYIHYGWHIYIKNTDAKVN